MDEAVTDVVFVSSKENCPKSYQIVDKCPCGQDAQLWEKVLGGQSGERYLCFTKEDKEDGMVIEDMYIPGRSAQYLYKGYKIVKLTVEGDEPMYHKQLAVKRVPRTHASKVIADIIICRSRDNVSKMYKKLDKVNGLCICFRQVDTGGRNTPSPKPTRRATVSSVSSSLPHTQRGGSLKISDISRHMAGLDLNGGARRASNPPGLQRTVSPLASHTHRTPSPQPPSPVHELTSTPPPSSSPPPPSTPYEATDNQTMRSTPPSSTPPPIFNPSSTPPPLQPYPPPSTSHPANHPPPHGGSNTTPYPPPLASGPSTNPYPPPSASGPSTNPYPPPSASGPSMNPYPPQSAPGPSAPLYTGQPGGQALGFGGLAPAGVRPPPPSSGYPSYPPQGPPTGGYGGYGAVAGPSFAAAPTALQNPSGPAPYNPYQSQQGQPSYPPSQSSGYGFKF